MAVSVIASASSLPPRAKKPRGFKAAPRPIVTEPPFSARAQKQTEAISTGRQPLRGRKINIVV